MSNTRRLKFWSMYSFIGLIALVAVNFSPYAVREKIIIHFIGVEPEIPSEQLEKIIQKSIILRDFDSEPPLHADDYYGRRLRELQQKSQSMAVIGIQLKAQAEYAREFREERRKVESIVRLCYEITQLIIGALFTTFLLMLVFRFTTDIARPRIRAGILWSSSSPASGASKSGNHFSKLREWRDNIKYRRAASELSQLRALLDSGLLTQEQFDLRFAEIKSRVQSMENSRLNMP